MLGVGSSSGLGLALGPPRPYAASTRPGPGSTALYSGLQSPLTRVNENSIMSKFPFCANAFDLTPLSPRRGGADRTLFFL